MIRADLHMHSTFSDGVLSPDQLMEEAHRSSVTIMSITDHDSFHGGDSLRGLPLPLRVIPGIELSLNDMRGLHLLGYGFSAAAELRSVVNQLAEYRVKRIRLMLDRLADMDMPLDWADLEHRCHGTVGRPHVAQAMVHAGYAKSMSDAFERYLNDDRPAYVPGKRLSIAEALPLMTRNGFLPVLAHPYELSLEDHQLCTLLEKWQSMGLRGMEVYHPSAASHGFTTLDRTARRMGLLVTGGSDFHQENDKHGRIGCTCDAWRSMEEDVQELLHAMQAES